MNPTDRVTLDTLVRLAVDGVVTISSRTLAEEASYSRTTAGKSLRRLTVAGQIEKVRQGQGLQSSRYRLLDQGNQVNRLTRIELSANGYQGVRDLFRSLDLYGAGCLWELAPKGRLLSVSTIVGWGVTKYPRTVRGWLLRLESLPVPLVVSEADPGHSQRQLWTFLEMSPEAERVNVEHLLALDGPFRPRLRAEAEARHQGEREQNLIRLGMAPHWVMVAEEILPNTVEDLVSGCLLYREKLNASGYGTVYPDYWGIGAHRMVWTVQRGPVPTGYELHHECQVRACVNVDHLTAMTRAEHARVHKALGLNRAECS